MKLISIKANKRLKKLFFVILDQKSNTFFLKYDNYNYNMDHLKKIKFIQIFLSAPIAQLDRALGYGPGGSGFKS